MEAIHGKSEIWMATKTALFMKLIVITRKQSTSMNLNGHLQLQSDKHKRSLKNCGTEHS